MKRTDNNLRNISILLMLCLTLTSCQKSAKLEIIESETSTTETTIETTEVTTEETTVETEETTVETDVIETKETEETTVETTEETTIETTESQPTEPVQTTATVATTATETTQVEILTYPVSETPSYWTDNGYTINSYQVDGVGTVYGYYLYGDSDLVNQVNSLREEVGVNPLSPGDQAYANMRAIESAYMGISHTRPNGQAITCAECTTSAGGAYSAYYNSPSHYAIMVTPVGPAGPYTVASASFQLMIWTPCEYFPEGGYWTIGESANVLCIW